MSGKQKARERPNAHTQGDTSGQHCLSIPIADLPSLRRQPKGMAGGQQKARKGSKGGTTAGANARMPKLELHKRGLPVAWGRDIFAKCPRLAERFSALSNVADSHFASSRPPE